MDHDKSEDTINLSDKRRIKFIQTLYLFNIELHMPHKHKLFGKDFS